MISSSPSVPGQRRHRGPRHSNMRALYPAMYNDVDVARQGGRWIPSSRTDVIHRARRRGEPDEDALTLPRAIEVHLSAGSDASEACRNAGISDAADEKEPWSRHQGQPLPRSRGCATRVGFERAPGGFEIPQMGNHHAPEGREMGPRPLPSDQRTAELRLQTAALANPRTGGPGFSSVHRLRRILSMAAKQRFRNFTSSISSPRPLRIGNAPEPGLTAHNSPKNSFCCGQRTTATPTPTTAPACRPRVRATSRAHSLAWSSRCQTPTVLPMSRATGPISPSAPARALCADGHGLRDRNL